MARLSRYIAVILVISILTALNSASSQTIPKPSVPEFTVRLVSHPYDVEPTTTVDPYTGKTKVVREGYHEENRTIELSIITQDFKPYKDANGNDIALSYNVSMKGNYDDDWSYYPDVWWKTPLLPQNHNHTVITFGYFDEHYPLNPYSCPMNISDIGQVDFRVEALIGYFNDTFIDGSSGWSFNKTFIGESSGWSSIQTLTISEESVSPSPTVPEFPYLLIIPLLLSVLAVALAFRIKKLGYFRNH